MSYKTTKNLPDAVLVTTYEYQSIYDDASLQKSNIVKVRLHTGFH